MQPTQATDTLQPSTVSLYDARPFFEKALAFGLQNSIIDAQKLDAISTEAPKGMVQIARYFGSEFLRPELEKAKDRMVNLVSLYLQITCAGDLRRAAESLRDHSFLSRSKGGSDLLKALITMPTSSHFGMQEHHGQHGQGGFGNEQIAQLAKWSLRSLADYQAELAQRQQVAQVIDAALWLADALCMDADTLHEAAPDAHAVIRTALLALHAKRSKMPDWITFDKIVQALRKKHGAAPSSFTLALPARLPPELKAVVQGVQQSILADAPKLLDAQLGTRKLFGQTPAFMGRYFWLEDALNEVDQYDRDTSHAWTQATGGHSDDSSLLTLFVCLAAGAKPQTLLSTKSATALLRKIRKTGIQPTLASQYIQAHAPAQLQYDCARLWADFVDQSLPTLQSDFDHTLKDALAVLVRDCNVT
jgi:hypothetical protein